MDEEFKKLQIEFNKIKAKGYIRGIYNNLSAIGRTLESELGLERNKESVPDYNGIELKARRSYSKSFITLFTAVPDGEEPLEINRLRDTYGYPSKKDRNYKVLYVEAYSDRLNFGGVKYQYKIDVDREKQKVYLCIYNRYDKLIERKVYWSFNYLEEKLTNKLKYLAIANAWPKEINGWNYFKYYKIDFYALKGFDKFLDLLEAGKIKFMLKIGIYTDEENYGKIYDHGCSFGISATGIKQLFYKYIIDVDKHI